MLRHACILFVFLYRTKEIGSESNLDLPTICWCSLHLKNKHTGSDYARGASFSLSQD